MADVEQCLADEGTYVHSEGDGNWWIPSGQMFYSPGSNRHRARRNWPQPAHISSCRAASAIRSTNQVNTETVVTYDDHRLLVVETRDAVGNTVRRSTTIAYCSRSVVTDPNGNRAKSPSMRLGWLRAQP